MNNKRLIIITVLVSFAVMACTVTEKVSTGEIPRISKEELKANLDNDSYVIVDVRISKDYDNTDIKITRSDTRKSDGYKYLVSLSQG